MVKNIILRSANNKDTGKFNSNGDTNLLIETLRLI
jgi:hypothetical protein